MENKIFAVIIGSVSDYGKDRFIIDPNKSKQANWLIKRATENGFFFETEEESLVFINEVTEFAKKLYNKRKKKEV